MAESNTKVLEATIPAGSNARRIGASTWRQGTGVAVELDAPDGCAMEMDVVVTWSADIPNQQFLYVKINSFADGNLIRHEGTSPIEFELNKTLSAALEDNILAVSLSPGFADPTQPVAANAFIAGQDVEVEVTARFVADQ